MAKETFKIPEENKTELDKKLAKLNKAAVKLNVGQTTYEVTGEEMVEVPDTYDEISYRVIEKGYTYKLLVLEVTFGEIPRLEGWELVAAIDHDPVQGNFVRTAPGKEILDSYREADNGCEHCGHKRNRKSTYICHHEDGRTIKVGSTCIKDFLGHTSPELVMYACTSLFGTETLFNEEREFRGCRSEQYSPLNSFLACSVKCIREFGWLSKGAAYETDDIPTINNIQYIYYMRPENPEYKNITPPTDADKEEALKVIEWAKVLSETNTSDYAHNASIIAKSGFVKYNQEALVASLVASYRRHVEKELERKNAINFKETSDFFGEVKTRYEMTLKVLRVKFLGENNYGGCTTLVKMTDGANLFSWFASRDVDDMEIGEEYKVKATVKAFNEFKGTKETALTRVAIQ